MVFSHILLLWFEDFLIVYDKKQEKLLRIINNKRHITVTKAFYGNFIFYFWESVLRYEILPWVLYGKIYNRLQYRVLMIFSSVCNLTLVNLLQFLYFSCCTLFSFLFFFRITGHYNFNRTYFPTGRSCSAIRRSSFLVYTIITPRRYN